MWRNNYKTAIVSLVWRYLLFCMIVIAFIVWGYAHIYGTAWDLYIRNSIGGILGGIGTLLAVYITTKATYDTLETTLMNGKKEFVVKLAEEIGVYIAQISSYHFSSLSAEYLWDSVNSAKNQLVAIECKIKDLEKNGREDAGQLDGLQQQRNSLKIKYEEYKAEYIQATNQANRLKANEVFFSLLNKLHGIEGSDALTKKLKEIHMGAGINHDERTYGAWIETQSVELEKIYAQFRDKYISQK